MKIIIAQRRGEKKGRKEMKRRLNGHVVGLSILESHAYGLFNGDSNVKTSLHADRYSTD